MLINIRPKTIRKADIDLPVIARSWASVRDGSVMVFSGLIRMVFDIDSLIGVPNKLESKKSWPCISETSELEKDFFTLALMLSSTVRSMRLLDTEGVVRCCWAWWSLLATLVSGLYKSRNETVIYNGGPAVITVDRHHVLRKMKSWRWSWKYQNFFQVLFNS